MCDLLITDKLLYLSIVTFFLEMEINMEKISSIGFLENYRILVELEHGSSFIYDLKPKLDTARFAVLKDKNLFKRGKLIEKTYIKWNDILMLQNHELINRGE